MLSLNYQMVHIQCQIFKNILSTLEKQYETLPTIPPIHIYINRINNRLMFKIKGGYKLTL